MNSCAIESCDRPSRMKSKSLCWMHYTRKRRGQDLNAPSKPANNLPLAEFVKARVRLVSNIAGMSDCWEWTGARYVSGYGNVRRRDCGEKSAHRLSYRLFVGEIPQGMYVCHKCDIRSCVNPEHLFLGTALENGQDMANKGRAWKPAGEVHPMAKASNEQVSALTNGDLSVNEFIAITGVSDRYARSLMRGTAERLSNAK